MNPEEILADGMQQLGLPDEVEKRQKLMQYLGLLQKWNRTYNLTAINKTEQMVSHHLLDSLAVLPHLQPGRWLDVGCGAGLPGLVLAIMQPSWAFDLLDSNSKKCSFVQQAIIELGIKNTRVHCARIESWQQVDKFDGVISRAFAEMEKFVTTTRHLILPRGTWVAMKGALSDEEIGQLPIGVRLEQIIPLQIPGLSAARCLAILKEV